MGCPSQNNEESLAPSYGRPAGGRTFFHRARTRPAACTMPRLSVGTWHSLGLHVGPHRKQACHNFLASLWHPLSFRILLVALNPYGELARSRSSDFFIFRRIFASGTRELAVRGSWLQKSVPRPSLRLCNTRDAMSTLEESLAWAIDAATALRSASASSLPAREGPCNAHFFPSTRNSNRANHPGFGKDLRTWPT